MFSVGRHGEVTKPVVKLFWNLNLRPEHEIEAGSRLLDNVWPQGLLLRPTIEKADCRPCMCIVERTQFLRSSPFDDVSNSLEKVIISTLHCDAVVLGLEQLKILCILQRHVGRWKTLDWVEDNVSQVFVGARILGLIADI